jgi:riboflavin transporter FmnP
VLDIKIAGFLSLEIKDALIVLCGLLIGPWYGMTLALLVPLMELFIGSHTGVYGFIMNTLSSMTFVTVVAWSYKIKKDMKGAVIGLVSGVCSVTAVMLLANLLVTPYYMGVTTEAVTAMIPTLLFPFNLVKATLNAAIVLLLYKPLSILLKRTGLHLQVTGVSTGQAQHSHRRTVAVTAIAVALIVASVLIMLFLLVLLLSLLQQVYVFVYSIYTELAYRVKV